MQELFDPCDLELLDADVLGAGESLTYLDPGEAGRATVDAATQAALQAVRSSVPGAIAAGERDENRLSDLEFFARHPERQGRRIDKSERELAAEWLKIREDLVRPALRRARAASGAEASAPQAAPPPPGSNAAVAEGVAAERRKQMIIAGALGGLALVGIGVAVTTS